MARRKPFRECGTGARAGAGGPRGRARHPERDLTDTRREAPTTGRRALHTWVAGLVLLVLGASLSAVSPAAAVTVQADQDAWLKQAAPNANFGADKEVSIKTKPGDSERAVFRFNLGGLPPNANIQSAVATFRVTTPDSSPVQVYRITQAWTENGVTWGNTANAYDAATVHGTFTPSQDDSVVTVNLTTLVQQWVAGAAPNHGIMLLSTSTDRQSKYHSKDMDVAAFRPVLEVTLVTPTALTPNPLTLTVGATGTLTATIAPAPSAAGNLTVSSANPGVATVPASVAFAANQTSLPIPVSGVGVGTAQITASLNGSTVMSTVDVNPPVLTVTSLTPASLSITQGGTGTLTVTINAVQSTHTVVNLTSSAASIAAVPATVTVPAGQTTAPVPVSANTVGQADLTASLHGTTATSHVTVTPALPTVVSLLPPATHVTLGASGTLTLTISAAQAANTSVTLAVTPANLVTLPSTVIVPANQTSATVSVTGAALGTALITASLNGTTATAAVDVLPPGLQLTALQPPTQKLVVDAIGTLTLQLHAQQTGPTVITLSVDPPTRLQVPPTVTVPPNQPQAQFTVTALTSGTATLTATLGSVSQTATVVVVPPPPSVVSLLPSPLPLVPGATGTLTLMINAAQPTDTVVPLTTSAPSLLDVPPSVTVPAGRTTVGLPVAALAVGTATVTATLNGTALATVQVVPPPVTLTALGPLPPAPAPLTLAKGRIGVLRVTVTRVPLDPTIVSLSNSATSLVTVPPTVTVPAGQLFADFPVTTQQDGTATITASLNSSSATAEVVVTAPDIDAVTLAPLAPTVFATEPVPFTATATMTDGTTQPLTNTLTWTSSNTTVATIDNTGLATTLTAGTTTIKAATTNSLGPVTGETSLTVQPAPALTLTPNTGNIAIGQNLNLVVTSAAPAGANGLTVTLTQSGTGAVTTVPTVVIPANGTNNSVVITGATFGQVTITASAVGRLPATATFTITPAPPTITGFTPTSGPVGTVVTVTGTNLNGSGPGSTTVKFNTTNAIITSVSATALTTTVPQGATTGVIFITTSGGTATSSGQFVVQDSQGFTLSAAPAQPAVATTVQGGGASYALNVTGSGTFTGLVSLGVVGLPAGVTAQLSSPTLAPGQTAILTLNTSASTPVGGFPITLNGFAQLDSGPRTQTISLTLQVLGAGGQTSVAGQLLRVDGTPIPNARMMIVGTSLQALTDVAGSYLIQNVPSGTQALMIDANNAVPGYPIYSTDIVLTAGQANVVPILYITPPPPPTAFVPISNAATDQIVTDQNYPGVEFKLPAGVSIVGWDGVTKNKVAIQKFSLDRLGVPPPPGPTMGIYQLQFGTPMGGFLTPPGSVIPVSLPNDQGLDPGEQAELWSYDASPLGGPGAWKFAGMGTVSQDGTKIVSDSGVGIQRFCGFCGVACFINRQAQQPNRNSSGPSGGDPVDLSMGQMIVDKTDLILPGPIPLQIGRTYNPFDAFGTIAGFQPALGPGWYLSIDPILLAPLVLVEPVRLVLPGNTRVDFFRQPNGTYVNTTHPQFKGSVLTGATFGTSGGSHELRFKDGTVWRFVSSQVLGSRGTEFLVSVSDRNANRIAIERDTAGKILRIEDTVGRVVQVTYVGSRISRIADPTGRSVQYAYDATTNRLTTVTDSAGGQTHYTYDAQGRILTVTDARNIQYIQNTYGASGRILKQTLADGGEFKFRYQLSGVTVTGPGCDFATLVGSGGAVITIQRFPNAQCPTEETLERVQSGYTFTGGTITATTVLDPRGNATTYRFSLWRFTTEQVDALGQRTQFVRDENNQLVATTDPLGRTTRFTYDSVGNVTTISDPNNEVTRFEYEPTFNRVTKVTDALNQDTRFTYDPKGNLLTATNPLNHTTAIAYSEFGQPVSVSDPLNNVTTFEYDSQGNLVATNDPVGHRITRSYDIVSRLLDLSDPRGYTTRFTYNNLNRVTQITDAINGLTGFTYDPNGNLLTVADAKNQITTYTYDNMDRLQTRKDPLPTHPAETYDYDSAGNLTRFVDRNGQQAIFQYDALNRRAQGTYPDATTTFNYDAVGRLTRTSDTASGAGTIEFSYDNLDRLIQEITGQGTVAYQYDVLGRRTQLIANGQQPVIYQYDPASRLTRVEQGALFAALGYDNAGRRTSLSYSNGTTTGYQYDLASRLTNITHNGPSGLMEALTYTYDAAGNRTSLTRNNGAASLLPTAVASATYDAANEQTAFAGATLTYDNNGNLTSDGTNTYAWDARNRLVGMSGGATANFNYDALGRRTSKTINGVSTQFAYDDNDIVAELGAGAVGASYLRALNIDEPFVRQSSSGNEHYHTDALGSSLALSNGQGNSGTTYTYEPFGKTTVTGTSSNLFQYTGRENDTAQIFSYRARYYSPTLHRFLQEDPIQALPIGSQILNRYSYVYNDPLSYRDPSGQIAHVPPLLVTGAIMGGVGAATGAIAQGVPIFSAQFASLTTMGIANGLVAGAFASAGVPIPPAAVGALTAGISNAISQAIVGRKPINIGSVAGATVGGGVAGAVKGLIGRQLAGAAAQSGGTLTPGVANAMAAGLGLGPQVGLPAIGASIGGALNQ